MKSLFRKPLFWVCFIIVSALCFAYAFKFFPKAFPIVNLTITMDRDQAVKQSAHLVESFKWGPSDYATAVSFDTDTKAKTFIELEGGGQEAFLTMLKHEWYMPYTWHVRLFREFETNETHIWFTPDGKPYGFKEIIAEDKDLPSLKKSEARTMAELAAERDWQIDLSSYELIEASKHTQLNGRIDRTFVYERIDITLKEGRYRLTFKVRGNKLTQIKHSIKVPQTFLLTYKEMRSANEFIAYAAGYFAYIFYVLIGCIFGLFVLIRLNWVIWQIPILWALLISSLGFLSTLNSLPLMWMYYKTECPMQGFYLSILTGAIYSFFIYFILGVLLIITAEGLSRLAFGHQVRFFKSWSKGVANSYTILGQTISGFLLVGIDLAFLVTFYYLATTYLHWWTPISQLVNPNVLAYYFPWLTSIAISLQAGFLEECQFRAIPLAGAALLGTRFGNRKWWLVSAFIMQAIVFGAAHSNYPSQPAYARLVELIIPSFIFAGVYLRFGLLPSIIAHYAYDVFWFAIPIFLSQTPTAWINQLAVLFFTFIPLLIIFYRRFQTKKWATLTADIFNITWQPPQREPATAIKEHKISYKTLSNQHRIALIMCCIVGGISWLLFTQFTSDAPSLKIDRNQAIELAQQALAKTDIQFDTIFTPVAQIKPTFEKKEKIDLQHKYIWQTYKRPTYTKLLGSFLNPPHWQVRLLRFTGTVLERAEEYILPIGASAFTPKPVYRVLSVQHKIAEAIAGAQLSKKEARVIAQQALINNNIDLETVYEVSATPKQYPERKDWTFTFGNKKLNDNSLPKALSQLNEGEARIVVSIAGDQVTHVHKKVHVPEVWQRNERKNRNTTQALQLLCQLLVRILFIGGMVIALLRWAMKAISARYFSFSFFGFAALFALAMLNAWPNIIAQFNTQEPFGNQVFAQYGSIFIRYLMQAGIFAFVSTLILTVIPRYTYRMHSASVLSGIAAGFIINGAWAFIEWFKPSVEPLWGNYVSLGNWSSVLGFISAYVIQFLIYTMSLSLGVLALNYITDYGNKRLGLATGLCILASLCLTGIQSIEVIAYWLASSMALGIVLLIIWYTMLRFAYASVPIAQAIGFCLLATRQLYFNVLPNIWFAVLSTIVIILCIAWYWFLISVRQQLHAP